MNGLKECDVHFFHLKKKIQIKSQIKTIRWKVHDHWSWQKKYHDLTLQIITETNSFQQNTKKVEAALILIGNIYSGFEWMNMFRTLD